MASVKHISVLEYRVRNTEQVIRAEFPDSDKMQEFVNQHRRVVSPEGRVIRRGHWDYATQSHITTH